MNNHLRNLVPQQMSMETARSIFPGLSNHAKQIPAEDTQGRRLSGWDDKRSADAERKLYWHGWNRNSKVRTESEGMNPPYHVVQINRNCSYLDITLIAVRFTNIQNVQSRLKFSNQESIYYLFSLFYSSAIVASSSGNSSLQDLAPISLR